MIWVNGWNSPKNYSLFKSYDIGIEYFWLHSLFGIRSFVINKHILPLNSNYNKFTLAGQRIFRKAHQINNILASWQ